MAVSREFNACEFNAMNLHVTRGDPPMSYVPIRSMCHVSLLRQCYVLSCSLCSVPTFSMNFVPTFSL